ncbi:MAG: DUF4296 domain-containing protein [Bacteroidales bacterium]|nr:DUF4296 domain-containing protein [Bacteroidales bacterium]
MNKESKILHHIAVAVALIAVLLASGCRKKGILSKNDVADIMYQMFVADEYAKKYPNVNKAADSLLLYQHIFDKYDCSLEDYRNSIKHYIADEKAYTYILKRAVQTAKDSSAAANRELTRERPHGILITTPYLSPGVEVKKDRWWERKMDGTFPTQTGFYQELQGVIREALENERRRNRDLLRGKKDNSGPELVLTEEAQKIRDEFRKNLDKDIK